VKTGKKSSWSAGVAIAFSTMLIVTGCASDTESAAGDGKALEKIAVSMPVIPPNFVMVMPWVAQEQGFYKEFGLEVDIVSLDSGVTALRGGQAGSADIAAVPTPTLINEVGQGATVSTNTNDLTVRAVRSAAVYFDPSIFYTVRLALPTT
jgi:ABC-type nitrate/sulfonate/bicarbonate transport system substrate-binding protein